MADRDEIKALRLEMNELHELWEKLVVEFEEVTLEMRRHPSWEVRIHELLVKMDKRDKKKIQQLLKRMVAEDHDK